MSVIGVPFSSRKCLLGACAQTLKCFVCAVCQTLVYLAPADVGTANFLERLARGGECLRSAEPPCLRRAGESRVVVVRHSAVVANSDDARKASSCSRSGAKRRVLLGETVASAAHAEDGSSRELHRTQEVPTERLWSRGPASTSSKTWPKSGGDTSRQCRQSERGGRAGENTGSDPKATEANADGHDTRSVHRREWR